MIKLLLQLFGVFSMLSLLAVGGGVAVLPEMKEVTVAQHQWLTQEQFVDVYSLGQLAPGPNMMMVTVIGYRVAGIAGALVVTIAFFLPASLLTFGVSRLWDRLAGSPWRTAVQRGLAPVAIGLMLSGVVTIARVATRDVSTIVLAATVLAVLLRFRINPAWIILASAIIGGIALRA